MDWVGSGGLLVGLKTEGGSVIKTNVKIVCKDLKYMVPE